MNEERINELAQEAYDHIFNLLDTQPDMDGDTAGWVAYEAEKAVKKALTLLNEEDTDLVNEVLSYHPSQAL